jgi:predicted kinase
MNRALILIRGLPGSGKSTLARRLAKSLGVVYFEADQFFVDSSGRYNFDLSRLSEAHRWCQSETRRCLESNFTVVVSNTFTTIKELRPYFDLAREFEIVPQVVTCENQFDNVHDVPKETLDRMRQRWASDIGELFRKD